MSSRSSTPAERARGCVFSEKFRSAQEVVENDGIVTSAPVIIQGMTTDGVDDQVTYPLVSGVKSISFWITLETPTEDIIQLSSSHSVEAVSGTLTASGLSSPTFYVNGVATATIAAARAHVVITTATAFDANNITVGADDSFGQFKIEDLQIWDVELSAQEASDFCNKETYSYRNDCLVHLPMLASQHDIVNSRTLDISGNGNHATFGDGATAAFYPSKKVTRGYTFDGSSDFMSLASNLFSSDIFTILVFFRFRLRASLDTIFSCATTGVDSAEIAVSTSNNRLYGGNVSYAYSGNNTIQNGRMDAVALVSDGTDTNLFMNGQDYGSAGTAGLTTFTPVSYIGIYGASSNRLDGEIFQIQIWQKVLTRLQIHDWSIRAAKQVNQV